MCDVFSVLLRIYSLFSVLLTQESLLWSYDMLFLQHRRLLLIRKMTVITIKLTHTILMKHQVAATNQKQTVMLWGLTPSNEREWHLCLFLIKRITDYGSNVASSSPFSWHRYIVVYMNYSDRKWVPGDFYQTSHQTWKDVHVQFVADGHYLSCE